jgi:hypothetical protein
LARLDLILRSRCIFSFAGRCLNQGKFALLDLLHTPAHLFPERRPTPINLS